MARDGYKKRVPTILEYISFDSLEEAGDEQNDQNGAPMPGDDPGMAGGGMPGGDPGMGGDPTMGDGMPGDDPVAGGDPGMVGAGPEGFAPQGADQMGGGLPGMDGSDIGGQGMDPNSMGTQPGPDDNVINIDDLTDSQEETEDKIDALSSKFSKLLDKLSAFQEKVEVNNRNIESLKQELEKRNPTPVEKMTLRSKNAYPFNVTPTEYWDEKETSSNYSTEDDNNGANDEIYKITKSDVDDIANWSEISKSLDNNKFGLKDILDF